MKLNQISDKEGARKKRMRVGLGVGSGKGKTAGPTRIRFLRAPSLSEIWFSFILTLQTDLP